MSQLCCFFAFLLALSTHLVFSAEKKDGLLQQDPVATNRQYEYRLLATSKTSTMQKELQEAGDEGFDYRGQTVFKTTFGGDEVALILERDRNNPSSHTEYKLLATKKTSTM